MDQKYCNRRCHDAARYRAKKNLKSNKAYAYINSVMDNGLHLALKFGIESVKGSRCKTQNKKSVYNVTTMHTYSFERRCDAFLAESECLRTLDCSILSKNDMPDGYTETTYCHNIEKIQRIYKKYGGTLIE